MIAKLHYTFTATPKMQLSIAHVASAPIEKEFTNTISEEIVSTDHASLGPDSELSPERVGVNVMVDRDTRSSVEFRNIVRRV